MKTLLTIVVLVLNKDKAYSSFRDCNGFITLYSIVLVYIDIIESTNANE